MAARFLQSLPTDMAFAIEFRDRAWLEPGTFDLLEETGTSLALSTGPWLDEAAARSLVEQTPGGTLYLRWMGTPIRERAVTATLAARDRELEAWARRILQLDREMVYAFFSNDYQGHSPASARRLQSLLGREPVPPHALSPQRELFG